ncbi:MAG: hypothetical protein FWG63_01450 [Defluviitaleaceae bacterium]|nr:hypothetical protein [Defluviitaleaceae bacterium]
MKFKQRIAVISMLIVASIVFVACGNANVADEANELQRLQLELELVQIELELARLQATQSETIQIEEEEYRQAELEEGQQEEQEYVQLQHTLRQQEVEEILLGEWFNQEFMGFIESMVFNPNGQRYSISTHFALSRPADVHLQPIDLDVFPPVQRTTGVWEVIDGIPRLVFSASYAEIILSDTNEEFQIFWSPDNIETFRRTPPDVPIEAEGVWVPLEIFANRTNIGIEARMRPFLGRWYFDLASWHFNGDGTGFVYVPRLGINPQTYMHFTFEVWPPSRDYDAFLIIRYGEGWPAYGPSSSMLRVNFGTRSGGSMTLSGRGDHGESVLLTRMFDINNTPFVDHQLETFMGIMGIIRNFLP